jgi:hypothetical protein
MLFVFLVVAVFLGIEIARDVFFSNLDDNATSILIAWVVIQSVFWIILEVLAIMAAKKKKQSGMYFCLLCHVIGTFEYNSE